MAELLQHLLSDSAQKYPDKDAVVYKETRITYGRLENISKKIAGVLYTQGVRSGDRVGIYLNKSVKSIASIFGVLKIGGVYVPIDPNLPSKCLAYIIKDCGIAHIISSEDKIKRIIEMFSVSTATPLNHVVFVDTKSGAQNDMPDGIKNTSWKVVKKSPEFNGFVERNSSDLAYIMYTSGSTGFPKGVMMSHFAALSFVDWAHDCFEISKDDVIANYAPLHFDLSVFDIFTTIKSGGTIVMIPEKVATFPATLTKLIISNKITVWYSVPSVFILLLTRGELEKYKFPDLRLILFAGEIFPIKYLKRLKAISQAKLFNLYGPTETNVCTFYEVKDISSIQGESVPIGKALPGYDVFAVNRQGKNIKPGEIGELCVSGHGLMLGYWGDVEKTQEKLLLNDFSRNVKRKVYHTGDNVTIDETGDYIFVDREDRMIKSRGYRVGLGEIETILYSHPLIKEAVVIAIPDEEVTNRLKAFIVRDDSETLSVAEIQEYCKDRVPVYMVPEIIEFCKFLFKTSTGKVDKNP